MIKNWIFERSSGGRLVPAVLVLGMLPGVLLGCGGTSQDSPTGGDSELEASENAGDSGPEPRGGQDPASSDGDDPISNADEDSNSHADGAPQADPDREHGDAPPEEPADRDAGIIAPCTVQECGPKPGLPSQKCADGSAAGPSACRRLVDGSCGYTVRSCPDAGADAGGGGESVGTTCGGIAALTCDGGQFCNYEVDAGGLGCDGTVADAAGKCQELPVGCDDDFTPVCGCDRRTYPNACSAHAEGVSVLRRDACTELDCEAIDGHPVFGTGPGPQCPAGEEHLGWLRLSSGAIPIEGVICCRAS